MDLFGFKKVIDLLIKRGLGFVALWAYSAWQIHQQETMFGIALTDSDKGFILVQLALICIVAHYFIRFWIARTKYYSPSSFSDGTIKSTIRARELISTVRGRDTDIFTPEEKMSYLKELANSFK